MMKIHHGAYEPSKLSLHYYATCNLGTGISGRLRGEIIGVFVNYEGSTDDFVNAKPIGEKSKQGIAVIAKQRG